MIHPVYIDTVEYTFEHGEKLIRTRHSHCSTCQQFTTKQKTLHKIIDLFYHDWSKDAVFNTPLNTFTVKANFYCIECLQRHEPHHALKEVYDNPLTLSGFLQQPWKIVVDKNLYATETNREE